MRQRAKNKPINRRKKKQKNLLHAREPFKTTIAEKKKKEEREKKKRRWAYSGIDVLLSKKLKKESGRELFYRGFLMPSLSVVN